MKDRKKERQQTERTMKNSETSWNWNQWLWWSGKVDLHGLDMLNIKMILTGSNIVSWWR